MKAFQQLRKSEQKWDKLLTKTSQLDVIKAGVTANSRKRHYLPLGMQMA